MQTRLSVCNQVLFLTLEKGFGRKLQALLQYLSPRPAAQVLAPIPRPKALLTQQPPAGQFLPRSAPVTQGNQNLTSLWKDGQHNIMPQLVGVFLGSSPTRRAPGSCFKLGCVPREPPRHPRSEAPCLNMRGIFRWHQFKFAHQPYKYESPTRRDV